MEPHSPRDTSRPGPRRIATSNLRDVARRAEVSLATASRALRQSDSVSANTRARVLRAAEDLDYVMNGPARTMSGRGPRAIAFVVETMIGPTFAQMAAGVEQVASPAGHLFIVSTTHGDPEVERQLIHTMREQRASAVLLVGTAFTTGTEIEAVARYHRELQSIGARLVLCGRPAIPDLPEIPSIDYDHTGGTRRAVEHLAELGHRRIAFIGRTVGSTAERRLDGYRTACDATGIRGGPVLEVANSVPAGEDAAAELLAGSPGVTAVVCETDNVAVGVYRTARQRGVAIPRDLSVIGFDDLPLVSDLQPGLSTIRAPFFDVGTRAGQIATGLEDYAAPIVLDTELVVRGSTGRPRSATPRPPERMPGHAQ